MVTLDQFFDGMTQLYRASATLVPDKPFPYKSQPSIRQRLIDAYQEVQTLKFKIDTTDPEIKSEVEFGLTRWARAYALICDPQGKTPMPVGNNVTLFVNGSVNSLKNEDDVISDLNAGENEPLSNLVRAAVNYGNLHKNDENDIVVQFRPNDGLVNRIRFVGIRPRCNYQSAQVSLWNAVHKFAKASGLPYKILNSEGELKEINHNSTNHTTREIEFIDEADEIKVANDPLGYEPTLGLLAPWFDVNNVTGNISVQLDGLFYILKH